MLFPVLNFYVMRSEIPPLKNQIGQTVSFGTAIASYSQTTDKMSPISK